MTTTTRRLGASAIALALATTSVAAPSAFAQESDVAEIASGNVNWPIKESFNRYINMPFAAGTIDAENVDYLAEENSFDWTIDPAESELDADGNGTLQLNGSIHYQAHHGGLDLKFDDVQINIDNGTDATITSDYHLQGALPGEEEKDIEVDDAEIATFELEETLVPESEKSYEQTDLQTSLLQGALDAFMNYELGPIDDGNVDVSITFDKVAEEEPGDDDRNNDDGQDNDDQNQDDSSQGSSDNAGIIAAIVALLGALGLGGAAFAGLIPGFDVNSILSQFGL